MADYADHFALVRQILAEAGHVPQAAVDAWQETGPLRVRGKLARRINQLADRGLLRIHQPERAATHFMLLLSSANPAYPGAVLAEDEVADIVTSAVRAFLNGYRPLTPGMGPAQPA